jgi:hypothetical protein
MTGLGIEHTLTTTSKVGLCGVIATEFLLIPTVIYFVVCKAVLTVEASAVIVTSTFKQ